MVRDSKNLKGFKIGINRINSIKLPENKKWNDRFLHAPSLTTVNSNDLSWQLLDLQYRSVTSLFEMQFMLSDYIVRFFSCKLIFVNT